MRAGCLAVLATAAARAQTPRTAATVVASLPAYEGQPVASVELAGWPGLDAALLLEQLPQKAQAPFSRALVDQSIGVLKRQLAGQHLQAVALQIQPETEGIRLLFVLEPAQYFGIYQFPGALRFSYTRLLEAAGYSPQEPYTTADVTAGVRGLTAFFKQEGYFTARVLPQNHPDAALGLVNVSFQTDMGARARFGDVILSGASAAQAARLRSALASWRWRLRRSAVLTGKPYSFSALQSAAQSMQAVLNGRDYLGAQVRFAGAIYHPETNRADVSFAVAAGPSVRLQVTGAHLWPWTRRSLLPIYQESRVDPELIQEGEDNLASYFAAHGYFDAVVETRVVSTPIHGAATTVVTHQSAASAGLPRAAPPTATVALASQTILYSIRKGPRRQVDPTRFQGNRFLSDEALEPQVEIKPNGFLSHGTFDQQLLQTSVDNLTALYQGYGYSRARISTRVSRPQGNVAVTFIVEEGPQDFVDSLRLEGNRIRPQLLAPHGLKLGPGTPFAQALIGEDRSQILSYYLAHGYLNATFHAAAQRLAGHPHQIAVVYTIVEGPQVRTAAVRTLGREVTVQRWVDRQTGADLRPGQFLSESNLLRAESQLYTAGIFDWAAVAPRRAITSQPLEDVVIHLHESARNSLVYGFGFDITNRGGSIPAGTVAVPGLPVINLPSNFITSQALYYGPSGNLAYTRLNLRGKDETLSLGLFAGRLDQHGTLTYSAPALFWTRYTGTFQVAAEHDSQNPIFTAQTAQVSYQLERPLNADQTSNLFLRYILSDTDLTRLLIPELVPLEDQHVLLSTLAANFLRDTRDNPLDAHRGILESYELDFSPRALGSDATFGKFLTQTAYYHRIPANIIWANSFRLGLAKAFDHSFVPLSQAFFSGGGSTLRGFPLDGAGPQKTIPACGDPNNPATCALISVPTGGNQLLILNSEFRVPLTFLRPGLGIVGFYDGGNVFRHAGFSDLHAGYTNTLGIGFRYNTPIGPIRIDLGHNFNPVAGIKSTQVFLTLGQAF